MDETNYPVVELMDRYCFYRQKYVMMGKDFTRHINGRFTGKTVYNHLLGNIALCVFAGPSNTKFLSVDVDYKDTKVVHKVVDTMEELGIPRDLIYVSTSGGKGYHVDIFFEESIYNWRAKVLYDLIIYFGGFNKNKVEYRPCAKQSIKIPLGVHQKTGNRCWFVDRETLEPIESFDYIKTTQKLPGWLIDKVIKEGNKRRFNLLLNEAIAEEQPVKPAKKSVRIPEYYQLTEPGTRHKTMIQVALSLYRNGGNYDSIHHGLEDWLLRQDQSLIKDPYEECMRDVDNITGWVMQKGRRRELGEDTTHEYTAETRIYKTDADRIITGSTKSARLMAFLFTIYCDRYEYCGVGQKKLCELLGISSKQTVVTAESDLADRKLFVKTKGGLRFTGDAYRKVTNKYRFPDDYKRSGKYYEITENVTADNIYDLYIKSIAALCDYDELAAHLTSKELEDCKHDAESGAGDAGGADGVCGVR